MTREGAPGGATRGTRGQRTRHIPVLLSEVVESLAPKDGEFFIDGTFGAGGYSRAILDAANCRVLAFDRDITAVRSAPVQDFPNRLRVINLPFSRMEEIARLEETPNNTPLIEGPFADGVVLDVGVSSMQIDEAERGFSFQHDGPLDMRMSAAIDPLTGGPSDTSDSESAAEFLNTADEEAIANVIYTYGEEHKSRSIARVIVKARAEKPLTRTLELADLILRVFHGRKIDGRHPATRTFQALRIYVNDELGELAKGLSDAERILKPGGRLVVVTFHSLEDRIVKRFLSNRSGKESRSSRHMPEQSIKSEPPSFQIVNSRPLTPSKGELDLNPRARSARLRFAIRTGAAPWPLDFDELEVPRPRI